MKSQVVLFGAGNNCRGVIKFLGRENIYCIIDNDERRWGSEVDEIKVISLSEFIKKGFDLPILITITTKYGQIMASRQLKEAGIERLYFAPFIQFGFYRNAEDVIYRFQMNQIRPLFYGNNPFTDRITEVLEQQGILYDILDCVESDYPVLNRELEQRSLIKEDALTAERDIFITDGKQHDLSKITNTKVNITEEYRKKYLPKHKELEQFKNIHKGKRCFLVGNGPSLSHNDLEVLRFYNEITFGVNRIYLSFDKTEWRPNYYIMVDSIMIHQDLYEIEKYGFPVIFLGDNYSENVSTRISNCFYFSRMPNYYSENDFSYDITHYVYGGNTVIYDAMQIAFFMGFQEIILLGVDMTQTKAGEDIPHFYNTRIKEEKLVKGNIDLAFKAFEIAQKKAEKQGIRILNATRGGNVEVFDRVDFDSLFENSNERTTQ